MNKLQDILKRRISQENIQSYDIINEQLKNENMTLSQKKIIPNSQIPFNDIPKISLIGALKQIQDILANADKMKDQPIDANNNNNVSSQSNDSLNPFLKRQNLISKKKFENADTSQQHDEWDFNFDITKNQVLFEKEKPISKNDDNLTTPLKLMRTQIIKNQNILQSNTTHFRQGSDSKIQKSNTKSKIIIKKQTRNFNSIEERNNDEETKFDQSLPKTNFHKRNELQSNKFLKFYRQQNTCHDGDREKATSIVNHLDYQAIKRQRFKYRDAKLPEPEVKISDNILINLGQLPQNQIKTSKKSDLKNKKHLQISQQRIQIPKLIQKSKRLPNIQDNNVAAQMSYLDKIQDQNYDKSRNRIQLGVQWTQDEKQDKNEFLSKSQNQLNLSSQKQLKQRNLQNERYAILQVKSQDKIQLGQVQLQPLKLKNLKIQEAKTQNIEDNFEIQSASSFELTSQNDQSINLYSTVQPVKQNIALTLSPQKQKPESINPKHHDTTSLLRKRSKIIDPGIFEFAINQSSLFKNIFNKLSIKNKEISPFYVLDQFHNFGKRNSLLDNLSKSMDKIIKKHVSKKHQIESVNKLSARIQTSNRNRSKEIAKFNSHTQQPSYIGQSQDNSIESNPGQQNQIELMGIFQKNISQKNKNLKQDKVNHSLIIDRDRYRRNKFKISPIKERGEKDRVEETIQTKQSQSIIRNASQLSRDMNKSESTKHKLEVKSQLTKIMEDTQSISNKKDNDFQTILQLERKLVNFDEQKDRMFEQFLMDSIKEQYKSSQLLKGDNSTKTVSHDHTPEALYLSSTLNRDPRFEPRDVFENQNALINSQVKLPNFSPSRMSSSLILRQAAKSLQKRQSVIANPIIRQKAIESIENQQMQEVFQRYEKTFDKKVKIWQINELLNTNFDQQKTDYFALKKRNF